MENNKKKSVNIINVIKVAGSFIALLIGAGFATGQEALQFFGSEGVLGLASIFIAFIILVYASLSLMKLGHERGFTNLTESFKYYLGDILGTIFSWYAVLVLFLSYSIMVAGAGAAINQYFGIPVAVGAGIMAFIAILSVFFGLKRMVDVIGSIGPTLSVLVIFIGLISIFKTSEGFSAGIEVLPTLNVLKAAPNFVLSGITYACLILISIVAVLPAIGNTIENKDEVTYSAVLGPVIFCVSLVVVVIALISNISSVYDQMIPLLTLSSIVSPALASIFIYFILFGIYTTATPMLWSLCSRFAEDQSKKYKLLAVGVGIFGAVGSLILPFSKLVNIIYPTVGYSGMIILGAMIVKHIKMNQSHE